MLHGSASRREAKNPLRGEIIGEGKVRRRRTYRRGGRCADNQGSGLAYNDYVHYRQRGSAPAPQGPAHSRKLSHAGVHYTPILLARANLVKGVIS